MRSMDTAPTAEASDGSADTISISCRASSGREPEFETIFPGITTALLRFPGCLDTRIFPPVRGTRDYRVVVLFAQESDFQRWEASEAWHSWRARGYRRYPVDL